MRTLFVLSLLLPGPAHNKSFSHRQETVALRAEVGEVVAARCTVEQQLEQVSFLLRPWIPLHVGGRQNVERLVITDRRDAERMLLKW